MEFNVEEILENLTDGVYFVDTDRNITYWNKAAERITGFSATEVMGRPCSDDILIHVDEKGIELCKGLCPLAESISDGASRETEVYLHHKNGHRVPVMIRVAPLKDETGKIVGGVELFSDNTANKALRDKMSELEKLALVDNLTKLSNRAHIESELDARFKEMERYGLTFGVLFMDIDHFKKVNDTYGHNVGDDVLKTVAATLKTQARTFDLYGRWGGEEFLGIIRNVDPDALAVVAERCRALIEMTVIPVEEKSISVTVSIGAAMARHGDTLQSIVKRADRLMYECKTGGRNRVTLEDAAAGSE